ncbi:hypothetical protein EFA69_05445 [Rufibacter immobilis]|uniref:Uncharacterized protein n=1 Tax=Rufibacter immobilis TaxID=1348778 RepID=A0A3M9N442_9BACT|nr:hypothetical protein [Rufibacter immobilis]RNI31953.1 hypothetical protein EFA69_05445 [Rufibacter immobilis]
MMESQYPEGSTVYANEQPEQKLTVRRYAKRVYYCTVQDQPNQRELVYYGRELSFGPDRAKQ